MSESATVLRSSWSKHKILEMLMLVPILCTPGALRVVSPGDENDRAFLPYLDRYFKGDWGDLFEEDKQLNDYALLYGGRLLASYNLGNDNLGNDKELWIVTESDYSVTTCLLSEEY